jgi:short-subunit dehydrogenase
MQLRDRTVLITGASRGIGAALARRFADAGARVALVARNADALTALAEELGGTAHPTDLTDPASVDGLIARMEAEVGPVDVLVNNAGIDLVGHVRDHSAADLEAIYRLNLLTPVELCRQMLEPMLARGSGHIVNISSMAGVAPFPGLAAYASTKAGLTQFTAGLRADLRGSPVRTTVVELGPVETDMLAHIDGYRPTRSSFDRFRRVQLLPNTPLASVTKAVVDAVEGDRRHVRLPRRSAGFAMLTESPRRLTEWVLTGLRHRESDRSD